MRASEPGTKFSENRQSWKSNYKRFLSTSHSLSLSSVKTYAYTQNAFNQIRCDQYSVRCSRTWVQKYILKMLRRNDSNKKKKKKSLGAKMHRTHAINWRRLIEKYITLCEKQQHHYTLYYTRRRCVLSPLSIFGRVRFFAPQTSACVSKFNPQSCPHHHQRESGAREKSNN